MHAPAASASWSGGGARADRRQRRRAEGPRDVAVEVARATARGIVPGLTVVLVGDDPASAVYVRREGEGVARSGHARRDDPPARATTTQAELLALVDAAECRRSACTAFSCRCRCRSTSIPTRSSAASVREKDVDGFHPVNVGKLLIGERDGFVPCTPAGVQRAARASTACDTRGRGLRHRRAQQRSSASRWRRCMMQSGPVADATVTVCHSRTRDLAAHTRRADILDRRRRDAASCHGDMVKPGAVVIDVGMNRIDDADARRAARDSSATCDFDGVRARRVAHHAGARRRGPDDDRHAAAEHRRARRSASVGARGPPSRASARLEPSRSPSLFEPSATVAVAPPIGRRTRRVARDLRATSATTLPRREPRRRRSRCRR